MEQQKSTTHMHGHTMQGHSHGVNMHSKPWKRALRTHGRVKNKSTTCDSRTAATSNTFKNINSARQREQILKKTQERY